MSEVQYSDPDAAAAAEIAEVMRLDCEPREKLVRLGCIVRDALEAVGLRQLAAAQMAAEDAILDEWRRREINTIGRGGQ